MYRFKLIISNLYIFSERVYFSIRIIIQYVVMRLNYNHKIY